MRNSYILFLIIVLLVPLVLPTSVSAATFYLNSTNSDLTGGSDWNKQLRTETSVTSTIAATILRSSTRTQYAFTNSTIPNSTLWEAGNMTVKVNVTALGSTSYLWLNVQVDRVNSAGAVVESSATSTEQKMTATGVKTFNISSKTWTAGSSTDRLRLRYIMRNSRSNADYAFTISQGDINSYIGAGNITLNKRMIPVASFTANQTTGVNSLPVSFTDTSTNTPTAWNYTFQNVTGNNTLIGFSTSQNPIYTFSFGNFSIKLNASNADGYNLSTQATFINVSIQTAVTPVASFTCNKNFIRIPNSITCTDTSTNTPTSWEWSWGDGTANSTTQNPSHTYLKRGKWNIALQATNAGGSNSATTIVRVFGGDWI